MSALSMLSLALPKEEQLFRELAIEYVKGTYKVTEEEMDISDEPMSGFTVFVKPNPKEDGESKEGESKEGESKQLYSEKEQIKRNVLVQCLSCQKFPSLDTEMIDSWIATNDEDDDMPFSELVLVIADHYDEKFVDHIKKVNLERKQYGVFKVSIVFWEDIESFLRRNRRLMKQYCPKFLEIENDLHKKKISKRDIYKVPDEATMKEICIDEMEEYGILRMLQIDPGIGFTIRLLIAADTYAVSMHKLEDSAKHLAEHSEAYRRMAVFNITYNKFVERMAAFCEVDMDNKWVLIIPSYRNEEVADMLGDLKAEVTDRMNELFKCWAHI